ncbi:MAG: orotidine-5'-phosphate decarboxylase, partial [Euryarchaeota archaeon]|nr:orotidine-5'-phosphate decarboxylase [Euryarchaeota archaeon]
MFTKNLQDLIKERRSRLCVGLDPAPTAMREKNTTKKSILDFCLEIVEETSEYAVAYKPNLQYIMPLGKREMRKLTKKIHENNALAILDLKLGDIGSSNNASMYWIKKLGFDAFTYTPFPGNVTETGKNAQHYGLGVFVLTLMSNPQASYFMKSQIDGKAAYEFIAEKVNEINGNAVIGATCKRSDLLDIASVLDEDRFVLVPGIGAQKGSMNILKIFKNTIVNVGRGIVYAPDPGGKAEEYMKK